MQLPMLRIESAGVDAVVGGAADPLAQVATAASGIDIASHRARQFESWMGRNYDLILAMERSQRLHIEKVAPFSRGKVFLFGAQGTEIEDPYRGGLDKFQFIYSQIEQHGAFWLGKLRRMGIP